MYLNLQPTSLNSQSQSEQIKSVFWLTEISKMIWIQKSSTNSQSFLNHPLKNCVEQLRFLLASFLSSKIIKATSKRTTLWAPQNYGYCKFENFWSCVCHFDFEVIFDWIIFKIWSLIFKWWHKKKNNKKRKISIHICL